MGRDAIKRATIRDVHIIREPREPDVPTVEYLHCRIHIHHERDNLVEARGPAGRSTARVCNFRGSRLFVDGGMALYPGFMENGWQGR